MALLREHQTLTSTQAAAMLGESSGTCSFHLRQLAKYGVVEPVPSRGTQRPWRATARSTSWSKDPADAETAAAARQLEEVLIDRYSAQAHEWLERREQERREWRTASWIGDALVSVTAKELAELDRKLDKLFAPYARRIHNPATKRPAGARAVSIISMALPREDHRLP